MYRVLIVEDDPVIAGAVRDALSRWGYEVRAAEDFQDLMPLFDAWRPHLALLDISLPYFNGYYWCAEIRKRGKTPVIFLSSHSEPMDIVMAVNMGGDDYIAKPVDISVLAAKIQALLRRSYDYDGAGGAGSAAAGAASGAARPGPGAGSPDAGPGFGSGGPAGVFYTAAVGGAVLDAPASCLRKDGQRISLTKNELGILQLLLERKGRIVSREDLMLRLWDSDEFVDDNTLTVNVNRLRRTLEKAGLGDAVKTHKGQGYSLHD